MKVYNDKGYKGFNIYPTKVDMDQNSPKMNLNLKRSNSKEKEHFSPKSILNTEESPSNNPQSDPQEKSKQHPSSIRLKYTEETYQNPQINS